MTWEEATSWQEEDQQEQIVILQNVTLHFGSDYVRRQMITYKNIFNHHQILSSNKGVFKVF